MGVRNKTIIGLKYDVHIGVHRGEEVRNKTIIGLKFSRWHQVHNPILVRNKTIIGLKFLILNYLGHVTR